MSVLLIHVTIELLLSSSVGLRDLGIVSIDVVAVSTLYIAPLGWEVVVLLVKRHAVLPVGHKAALVALDHLQLVAVLLLLVLSHFSHSCCGEIAKSTLLDLTTAFAVLRLLLVVIILTLILGFIFNS